MMRQDRFTEQAQEVLQASQEMVRKHRHAQWDVEHVFLALLQHKDGFARQHPRAAERARRRSCANASRDTSASAPKLGLRRRPDLHDAAHRPHARGRERRGRAPQGRVRRRRAPADRDRRRARGRVSAHPARVPASTRSASTAPCRRSAAARASTARAPRATTRRWRSTAST